MNNNPANQLHYPLHDVRATIKRRTRNINSEWATSEYAFNKRVFPFFSNTSDVTKGLVGRTLHIAVAILKITNLLELREAMRKEILNALSLKG